MSLSQYIPKSEDSFLSVVPNIFFNVLRQQVLMSFLICFFHNMNKRHLHPKKSFFHPLLESFFTNKLVCNFCNFSCIISHLFFSQKFYTVKVKSFAPRQIQRRSFAALAIALSRKIF